MESQLSSTTKNLDRVLLKRTGKELEREIRNSALLILQSLLEAGEVTNQMTVGELITLLSTELSSENLSENVL